MDGIAVSLFLRLDISLLRHDRKERDLNEHVIHRFYATFFQKSIEENIAKGDS